MSAASRAAESDAAMPLSAAHMESKDDQSKLDARSPVSSLFQSSMMHEAASGSGSVRVESEEHVVTSTTVSKTQTAKRSKLQHKSKRGP